MYFNENLIQKEKKIIKKVFVFFLFQEFIVRILRLTHVHQYIYKMNGKRKQNELDDGESVFTILNFLLCGEIWTSWDIQPNDGTTCIGICTFLLVTFFEKCFPLSDVNNGLMQFYIILTMMPLLYGFIRY